MFEIVILPGKNTQCQRIDFLKLNFRTVALKMHSTTVLVTDG